MRIRTRIAVVVILAVSYCGYCAEREVPGQYPSIQKALDDAQPGDTIRIAAGTYTENLTVPETVTLAGAGADAVIVQTAADNGVVLTITGVKDVAVSGIAFQHSSPETDNDEKSFPDLAVLDNASATFSKCIFQNGAGCGIVANGNNNLTVEECISRNHVQSGFYVGGKNSVCLLRGNECQDNKMAGIWLDEGTAATVEKNLCANNGGAGIRMDHTLAGTALRENTLTENDGFGILAEYQAEATLEANQCRANKRAGIRAEAGAKIHAINNVIEENKGCGIIAVWPGTMSDLEKNTVRGNKSVGIMYSYGASGTLTGNTITGNGDTGIALSNWNSILTLKENECSENGGSGISCSEGCGGAATANRCRANKAYGILIQDEGTVMELDANECADNALEQEHRIEGAPASKQNQIWGLDTGYMLRAGMYAELEELAHKLRVNHTHGREGLWELEKYYDFMAYNSSHLTAYHKKPFEKAMTEWLEAIPDSVTARILRAKAYHAYTQDDENSERAKKELLVKGETVLEEARLLEEKDPELYCAYIYLGYERDYPRKKMDDLFAEGVAVDKTYGPLYEVNAYRYLPSYGGASGEIVAFIEKAGEDTRDTMGDRMYAWLIFKFGGGIAYTDIKDGHFGSWPRIDRGMAEINAEFPESKYFKTAHFAMACVYDDREKARVLLEAVGDSPEMSIFRNRESYTRKKMWAEGADISPVDDDGEGDHVYPGDRRKRVLLFAGAGLAAFFLFLALLVTVAVVASRRMEPRPPIYPRM